MKTKLLSITCALALGLAWATPAQANDYGEYYYTDPTSIAVDAVLVRPISVVATVVGSALFVISLPFSAPSKSVHRTAQTLVVAPAKFAFCRPMGDLDSMGDY